MYLVVFYVGEYEWVCGCVYKIEKFRTLSARKICKILAFLKQKIFATEKEKILYCLEFCKVDIS
jgi:hypothetical protein